MERKTLWRRPSEGENVEYVIDRFGFPASKKPRKEYITLDENGEPEFDMRKIFPDPDRYAAFMSDSKEQDERGNLRFSAVALGFRYPEWEAITDRPADVVYYNLRGHPACT